MLMPLKFEPPEKKVLVRMVRGCLAPITRSMREFAEQEVRLPNGPFEGRLYNVERQPYAAAWFDLVDSGLWWRHFATGPTQTGKTLTCFVIPIMYHLFERRESVVCGVPSLDMVGDKWNEDIKPVIEASRYAPLLPATGKGSSGGSPVSVRFQNGTTLRFMTGGGNDKARSAFTAPVLCVTETNGFDVTSETSEEASKLEQLEGRTQAFARFGTRRHYYECTQLLDTSITNTEITQGTDTSLMIRCPHCSEYVLPEREHLVGWKDAQTIDDARDSAMVCPSNGCVWSEDDRELANQDMIPVHRGQEVQAGEVVGNLPRTDTLGFRWSATHNMFIEMAAVAAEEWRAERATSDENGERKMCQFYWAIPYTLEGAETDGITPELVAGRINERTRRVCPDDTDKVTVAVDVGKRFLHWAIMAHLSNGASLIVDYGVHIVSGYTQVGVEEAIKLALTELADDLEAPMTTDSGDELMLDLGGVDVGTEWREAIVDWCKARGPLWVAVRGLPNYKPYDTDKKKRRDRNRKGGFEAWEGAEGRYASGERFWVLNLNADYWKLRTHNGFMIENEESRRPFDENGVQIAGSITIWGDNPRIHLDSDTGRFAKQVTYAQWQIKPASNGKPAVEGWVYRRGRKNDHYQDAVAYALALGGKLGIRLVKTHTPATDSRSLSEIMKQGKQKTWAS